MATCKSEDTLTTEEVAEGIAALSEADWLRIKKVARFLTGSNDVARDLQHDAIDRALSGERQCRRDVTIPRFLCEAMRSIISSQRKSDAVRARTELAFVSDPTSAGRPDQVDPGPFVILASEDECARIRSTVLELFADDQRAQTIADGRMEGFVGEDLCDLAHVDKKALAAKNRLIRRRVEGAFPKGWHNGN
jgi:DNA-directed RNA polymerase specialized sigma24 family protein